MTFIKLLELKDEKLKEMNQRVIIVLHQHSILQIYTYNCSSNWVIRDKRGWIDDTGMEFSFRRYPSNILAGERRINEGSADDGQRASGSRFDRVSILLQRVTRRVSNETRLNGANEVIEKQCNGNSLAKLPIEPRWIQAESGVCCPSFGQIFRASAGLHRESMRYHGSRPVSLLMAYRVPILAESFLETVRAREPSPLVLYSLAWIIHVVRA